LGARWTRRGAPWRLAHGRPFIRACYAVDDGEFAR
jgi:hypothetical protein